jgi:hypothetical protein
MKSAAVALLVCAALTTAYAQNRSGDPTSAPQPSDSPQVYRTTGARIAIGRSIHVPADEEVNDAVVVVGGSVRVDGRVRDGVVVVGGNLDVGPKADVRGEVVVVGGRVNREPGAQIRGRVSDVSFGDWSTWSLGGLTLPVVDFGNWGRWLGLLGTAFRVALLAVIMAIIIGLARAPVARIGRSAGAEPVRAFLLGLAAEVLFVPALIVGSLGLIVTIIGIPLVAILVPIAIGGIFIAMLLGFTAVTCRLGEWLEDRFSWRADSALVATALGLMLIVGPTMLARFVGVAPAPIRISSFALLATGVVIEFVVWTIGLGAALMTGFGRWSTAPPPVPPLAPSSALPAVSP